MYEKIKQEVLDAARTIKEYELIALTGGNVSAKLPDGNIVITPSGMDYFSITIEDMVVLDTSGNIIEGTRRPSVDTIALLYIYENRADVGAIIHTHQPYATAIGLIESELPASVSTLVNATKGSVRVAPYQSGGTLEMGIASVEYMKDRTAVIIKQHGVIAVGETVKDALYSCVYLEEAAKTYSLARAMSDKEIPVLPEEEIQKAANDFYSYGQKK